MDAKQFTEKILLAKADKEALNRLIVDFAPFIKKCVAGVFEKAQARREHLTDGMLAFARSVETYEPEKGSFIAYAAAVTRNSLINAARKEKSVTAPLLSMTAVTSDDTDGRGEAAWEYEAARRYDDERKTRMELRAEIAALREECTRWGFDVAALAKSCPKQKRSRELCRRVVQKALEDPELTAEMLTRRVLPLKRLAAVSGVAGKKLEYYRCYIAALMLIHAGEYPYLRAFMPEEPT